METENELMQLAQDHPDNEITELAMAKLRDRFDKTYIWCVDCDGLVVKEKDCCLNRVDSDFSDEDIIF